MSPRRRIREQMHQQRHYLGKPGEPPLLQESWVIRGDGSVGRYALAYIDFSLFAGDNGRVLGYDNAHGFHERHFMGEAVAVEFTSYEDQAQRFFSEVAELRKTYG